MRTGAMKGAETIYYGETPYGWELNAARSRLVLCPTEQRVISVVRHLYMSQRLLMREIVARLKHMGVKNRRGRPFGLSGVWEIIHRRNSHPAEAKAGTRRGRR